MATIITAAGAAYELLFKKKTPKWHSGSYHHPLLEFVIVPACQE